MTLIDVIVKSSIQIFQADEKIMKPEGCSGAPIFDNEGKIVAIACHIRNNTKMIYGFSIQKCMQLIKLAVETKQI